MLALYAELPWLSLTATLLLLVAAALVAALRPPGARLVCALLVVGAAAGYYHWRDAHNGTALLAPAGQAQALDGSAVTVRGRIASPVVVDGDRAGFVVEADDVRFHDADAFPLGGESVQVSLRLLRQEQRDEAAGWRRGDALTLQGELRSPSPARNFGSFDYRRYLRLHRIHWLITAKGTEQAEVVPARFAFSVTSLLRASDGLRDALGQRMDRLFPGEHAGLMKGMLIGMQDDLDPQRFQQFSELGLTHILAISGLNVAVFLGVAIWVMRRLRLTRETYLAIAMALMPVYIVLTGASPSIVRAGLMAMLGLFAARRKWSYEALHLVAIVGWAMLLWDPYYVLDVSFQLSFLVTLGLIVGVPAVDSAVAGRLRPEWLRKTLAITFVSQAVSFPLSIYYFNQFSLLSWLANAALVPVISLIVFPAGLITLAAGLLYMPLGQLLGRLVGWLNQAVFWLTDRMQAWSVLQTIWPSPSLAWLAAYFGLLAVLYAVLRSQKRFAADPLAEKSLLPHHWQLILVGCGLLLLLWIGYNPQRFQHEGLVQFLDVGQGDSILIRTPDGKHLLIDGGGTLDFSKPGEEWKKRKRPYEVGGKLLVPLLKKRGVHHLDMLIMTHEDADHSGGLQAVVEQLPVKQFWFNGTYKPNRDIEKLFQTALDKHIPLLAAEAGSRIQIDRRTALTWLHPFPAKSAQIEVQAEQNNASVVFLLEMEGTRWLFTGDMEKETENAVLQRLGASQPPAAAAPPIDVLKVAHHGSRTSTTEAWLDYWRPRTAVISVGATNSYGHPSPDVLTRLGQNGINVLRTDEMGEVQLRVVQRHIFARTKLQPP